MARSRRFLVVIGCVLSGVSRAFAAPAVRPNIVLILADDLGFSDLGCYGSEIRTPNVDRLAERGVRFTRFYNATRCCPSRAALLTGLYPHQTGIGHMSADLGLPGYQSQMNDRCVTIAEVLRDAGYQTRMSGKWHLGTRAPHTPKGRGFDHYFGLLSGACSYFALWPGRPMAVDDEPFTPGKGFYMTDAITDRAIAYLDECGRTPEPFFLYVAYTAPHAPLHALPEDIARYEHLYDAGWDAIRLRRYERLREAGLIDPRWALPPRNSDVPAWENTPDRPAWARKMAVYAAQVDRMDQGIGRILEKLRLLGVEEKTLVLFLSDNGACAEELDFSPPGARPGDPECDVGYGVGWAEVSDTPFRMFKRGVHEGGIATPFIASWPAAVRQPGSIVHDTAHVIDVMPTCLEAAGASYPASRAGRDIVPLEGRSVLPVLRGEPTAPHETLCWEHEGNRAVRRGRWKLVSRYLRPWELYDLDADRTELNNLAATQPEIVASLAGVYEQWATRCGVVPPHELPAEKKRRRGRPETVVVRRGEPQLFVDDGILAESHGLRRTLHSPRKDNGGRFPVIAPRPGSETLMAKGSIVWDERRERYVMFVKDLPSRDVFRLTSPDGLTWAGEKGPEPDPVEIDDRHPVTGHRGERREPGMHCFHYDAQDAEYPYKGWAYFGNWGVEHEGVYFLRSRDGLRWERGARVVDGYAGRGDLSALRVELTRFELYGPGDTSRFAFDPATRRFLGIFKFFTTDPVGEDNHLRSRAFLWMDRLDRPVPYRQISDVDLLPFAVAKDGEGAADEYYESNAWRYGPIWLGELLVWHGRDDYDWSAAGGSFIRLISSGDGLHWRKTMYDGDAGAAGVFLAGGEQGGNAGRNDGGHMSLFSQGPLQVGDELIFYYGASSWGKTAAPGRRVTGGGIFRARLRRDGFVSVDAGDLTTVPLTFEGDELFVNAVGPIGVEVLDPDGRAAASATIEGDSTAHRVAFNGKTLKNAAPGGQARLRFRVAEGGRLYSFTVR